MFLSVFFGSFFGAVVVVFCVRLVFICWEDGEDTGETRLTCACYMGMHATDAYVGRARERGAQFLVCVFFVYSLRLCVLLFVVMFLPILPIPLPQSTFYSLPSFSVSFPPPPFFSNSSFFSFRLLQVLEEKTPWDEDPLFLYLAHQAMHTPVGPAPLGEGKASLNILCQPLQYMAPFKAPRNTHKWYTGDLKFSAHRVFPPKYGTLSHIEESSHRRGFTFFVPNVSQHVF